MDRIDMEAISAEGFGDLPSVSPENIQPRKRVKTVRRGMAAISGHFGRNQRGLRRIACQNKKQRTGNRKRIFDGYAVNTADIESRVGTVSMSRADNPARVHEFLSIMSRHYTQNRYELLLAFYHDYGIQYENKGVVMKQSLKTLLVFILSIFLFACAGKPVEEPLSSPQEESLMPQKMIKVWKVKDEIIRFPDGFIDKVIHYDYDAAGNLQDIIEKTVGGELVSRSEYEWKNGDLIGITHSDQNGKTFQSAYTMKNGRVIEETRLDEKNEMRLRIEYQYAENQLKESMLYDEDGILQITSVYNYEDGNLVSVNDYLPNGIYDAKFERIIEQGRVMSERTLLPDGTVEKEKRIEYKEDLVDSEAYFSDSHQIKSVQYGYDGNGNIIRETWRNRSGQIYEIVEKQWMSFDEEGRE